jgi:K+-transporting ATPase ATPase B chain
MTGETVETTGTTRRQASTRGLIWPAIGSSFAKLDPRQVARNPVMFVVEVGSVITSVAFAAALASGHGDTAFVGLVSGWLWFTVLFANFATSMAEGRGKAQADTLRRTKTETVAHVEVDGELRQVAASELRKGDVVLVVAGEVIPGDGDVIEGIA